MLQFILTLVIYKSVTSKPYAKKMAIKFLVLLLLFQRHFTLLPTKLLVSIRWQRDEEKENDMKRNFSVRRMYFIRINLRFISFMCS